MFHRCSELPSTVPRTYDVDYRDYLERTYELVKFSGSGNSGVVLEMRGGIAIKVMPYSKETEYEVEVACKLNQLAEYTKCFVNTIGWFGCRKIPNLWKNYYTAPQDYYLCMVMEEIDGPIDSFELTEEDVIGLLFELLHAIYIARKLLNYSHNDIHTKNIMVNERRKRKTFEIDDRKFTFNGRFTPKLIDQGNASFGIDRKSNDLFEIEEMTYEIWDIEEDGPIRQFFLQPEWKKGAISQSSNYQVVADILLSSPLFDQSFYFIGGKQKFEETTLTDLTRIRDVWKKVSDNYGIEQVLLLRRINNRFKDIVDDEGFIAYYIGNHTDEMRRVFANSINRHSDFMASWIRIAIDIIPDQHRLYFEWAIMSNNLEIAQLIPIDPSFGNNQSIRLAARDGFTEIVRWLLLDNRVDPTDLNNDAICIAAQNGHLRVVKMIAERIGGYPERVLQCAIVGSHVEVIRYLLKHMKPAYYMLAFRSEIRAIVELFYNERITFQFAIENRLVTLLQLLMERRDPSENNNYAFRLAIAQVKNAGWNGNNRTMARMLLSDPRVRANLSVREIVGYDRIYL